MPDIKLPNGKIIKNVPDGVTKEQVMEKAISSGQAKRSDFEKFLKSTETMVKGPDIYEQQAKGTSIPMALAVSAGKGMHDISRGLGMEQGPSESEKKGYEALSREHPVSTFVGEVIGQSAPFVLPQTAVGYIPQTAGRIAGSTLLGGVEGGAISNAEGQGFIQGAGIGGGISGFTEMVAPHISRFVRKAYNELTGSVPKGALLDRDGLPTPELKQALDDAGYSWESLKDDVKTVIAKQPVGSNPEEVARIAKFEEIGAPITQGQVSREFDQLKREQGLLEAGSEMAADPLRSAQLQQSEAFKGELTGIIDDLGMPQEAGDTIKQALTSRRKFLKKEKDDLYKLLGSEAEKLDSIPIMTEAIFDSLPDAGTIRRVGILSPNQTAAVKDLLVEYGIDQSIDAVGDATKKGIKPSMLGINNFEDFRVALNAIEKSDISGAITNITGPIKRALDEEIEIATSSLEGVGGEISQIAKAARQANTSYKTEFDPAKITSKLIDSVKRGSTQPKIEASKVYNKVMSPTAPIEDLERVMDSLLREGSVGKKAIGDMQSRLVMDLIDSAFSAQSRQVSGTRIFGATPFSKQYEKLKPKIDVLFKNNQKEYKRLNRMYERAQDIIPPAGAMPKGSAGFFIDALNKIGVYSLMSKFPAAGPLLEMFKGLGERANSRKIVENALNAKPKVKEAAIAMDRDYPQIAAALGISGISIQKEEQPNP